MPAIDYTSRGGGFSASIPGGEGYGLPGGGTGVPPGMEWLVKIAKRKADQEAAMRQLQLDAARQARAPKLGAAPDDPYSAAMTAARAQADATSELSRGRARDLFDTKSTFDANTNDFYGTRMAHQNAWFQNLPAAQAVQTGQQFPNGWDVYTELAKAGKPTDEQTRRAASHDDYEQTPESIADMAARMYPRTQRGGGFGLGSRRPSGAGSSLSGGY